MNLLEQFGVDYILLAAQIVNFLIVFYVLKKFLYKPILTMLKNREKTISDGLKQAEEARILLEQSAEKERAILKKAQAEAKQLLEETRQQRDEILKKAEESARKQTEAMLAEAKAQIAYETQEAEKRLTGHISQLAVTFLQKSVADLFSEADQEAIMKKALKRMNDKAN